MTSNLMAEFINQHNYDIRISGNGRWIDQKCTMDELCFVADCIVVYLQEDGKQPFSSPDIWRTDYAISNVQALFCKPDPTSESTKDEYNKFFRQPMKMLAAAGILRENKVKHTIYFSVENQAILEHLSLRERNCMEFLCLYIEKTLRDSGLWDAFESFFDEQTEDRYDFVKEAFSSFCIDYTKIRTKREANRIFTKVLNPLAIKYHKKGSVKGGISRNIITIDQIKYNRPNFRDVGKDKNVSRQDFLIKGNNIEVVYEYNIEKVKRRLQAYNDLFNGSRSEVTDEMSIGLKATAKHHIFPKHEFPTIADYIENIIVITSAQHMQKAHPGGNTKKIDRDYQYMCLICKTDSIRKNLIDNVGDPIYDFKDFMFVLDTGLCADHFTYLSENDFASVIQGIKIHF